MGNPQFRFVDLFAGIGGFHAALTALGGECVWASEWDLDAARIYEKNWGLKPHGDITDFVNDDRVDVPDHDILTAGFPCQPFSKSGKQLGMEETRGTLFYSIAKIVEAKKPRMVLLENVRNIAGPRHIHEWAVIIKTLRDLGYRVSSEPLVISPHKIRPEFGGRPQVRDRVFICATRLPDGVQEIPENVRPPDLHPVMMNWDPQEWDLVKHIGIKKLKKSDRAPLELSENEKLWLTAWNDFVITMWEQVGDGSLPGFPIWVDAWVDLENLEIPHDAPKWKQDFLQKNSAFYTQYKDVLDDWLDRHNHLSDFPVSRTKFEWQAQRAKTLYETVMHFRPSGIRAKRATYLPALVAITQTSILGWEKRRISPDEGRRLQGFPDWFNFHDQKDSETFKQLGNAVCVGAVFNVLRAHATRDVDLLTANPDFIRALIGGLASPDLIIHDKDAMAALSDNNEQLSIEDTERIQLNESITS